jgi:glutamyl-tRNA reductase
MPIVSLGLSHRTAPPEVRDRHAVPSERIAEALQALSEYHAVREAAILSTCNRLEIYADVESYESGVAHLKEFLTTYRAMRVEDFDKYLYTLLGAQAVEHLLRVACGLDSMLLGEPQIMHQVKDALRLAHAAGSVGPHLHRLFRVALQAGKEARHQTAIGRNVVSLGAAAVELAATQCDVSRARCTVIGAGTMGTTVAKHLHERHPTSLTIVNRTLRRAATVADIVGGTACGIDALPRVLTESDLVISAVGSGGYLITQEMLRAARQAAFGGSLVIVDIGVPRDVEPSAALLRGVRMYSIEDLREVVNQSLRERRAEIPAVEDIVMHHAAAYQRWYHARAVAPLIAALRRKAEAIRAREIDRLFARMPELNERQRQMVVAASASIINKLLHGPVVALRERATQQQASLQAHLAETLLDADTLSERLARQLDAHVQHDQHS